MIGKELAINSVAFTLLFGATSSHCFGKDAYSNCHQKVAVSDAVSRKSFLASSIFASIFAVTNPAVAFDNRLDDKYLDRTPQTGVQSDNLGVKQRDSKQAGSYTGLAPCPGSSNCWCSSTPFNDNPGRWLESWGSKSNSIKDVKKVIDTYEVGQNGIDGGGFKVMKYDEKGQYLYTQFQSYKSGYIDDMEVWFNAEKNKFDVRSASRIGASDFGVNGKRLNYIGGRLEKEFGWEIKRRKNGSLV